MPILTKTTTAYGSSPIRTLQPVPQHVDQVQSGFYYLYLSDFYSFQLIYGCARALSPASAVSQHSQPQELQQGPGFQQCWSDQGWMQHQQLCPIPTLSTELPSQADHKGQHLCPSSLVSVTAFTIYRWESGLDWGGGEKSLCYQNCKNTCRRQP